MIYLYSRDSSVSFHDTKFIVKGKTLRVEVTNKETQNVLEKELDLSNQQYNTFVLLSNGNTLEIIEGYRYTFAFRREFYYLQSMLNKQMIAVFKIGKMNKENYDMIIELINIKRTEIEIETDMPVKEEKPLTDNGGKLLKQKRRVVFPTYAIEIENTEYFADDRAIMQKPKTIEPIKYSADYIDIKIKKYEQGFESAMLDESDNEKVYIESTCGTLNAQMVQLKNGEAVVRLYPFDYEGIFTIKVGWRWNRVINQYDLVLKKAE